MEKNIEFDFTVNKWGGFELGDGEYFADTMQGLIDSKPDFFIFTEEKEDFFETTFIPNPFERENTTQWTDKDWIEMFTYAVTYKTSKQQVIERLSKDETFGIYKVNKDSETIVIGDMFWYYLGLHDTGGIIKKCEIALHEKYSELMALGKQFILS